MYNKTKALTFLGRRCSDIVTGFEGICIAYSECLFGCSMVLLQTASNEAKDPKWFLETRIQIVSDEVIGGVKLPEYKPPRFLGDLCRDVITGFKGIVVQRQINLFNADQYCIAAKYNRERLLIMEETLFVDEGRIRVLKAKENDIPEDDDEENDNAENDDDMEPVSTADVASERRGGLSEQNKPTALKLIKNLTSHC